MVVLYVAGRRQGRTEENTSKPGTKLTSSIICFNSGSKAKLNIFKKALKGDTTIYVVPPLCSRM